MNLFSLTPPEKLIEMGFIEENDGSGDPRGIDYNIRNENFHLLVDPWREVRLCRPNSEYITIKCDDLSDLQIIVDFISAT